MMETYWDLVAREATVTKTITFYGSSDDTFGWEGPDGGDEHCDCANYTTRVFHVMAPGPVPKCGHCGGDDKKHQSVDRLAVSGVYGLASSWCIGIGPVEENDNLPAWPMGYQFVGYTVRLRLEVPVDAVVTLAHNGVHPVESTVHRSHRGAFG